MTPILYRTIWTPFDEEMRAAMLRPTPGPVYYDGPECDAFEQEMAAYVGTGYGVAVSSGSAAVLVALLALGVGPGDEVVLPANGYVALAECVLRAGARPRYADVLDATANLDISTVEPLLTAKTRAIMVQHTFGHPVDMDPLLDLAKGRGIFVIEDAAHGLGGAYKNRRLGGVGDISVISFARKCVTVAGQGGMSLTANPEWAGRMTRLRRHGWDRRDPYRSAVDVLGYNFTLNEGQAAVGRVSLTRLDQHRAARAENARRYTEGLSKRGIPVRLFEVMPWATHGWLHYVIKTPRRDALLEFLLERGIECGIHYRQPVYRQPAYIALTGEDPGPRPVTDRLADEILTLPSHPDMGDGVEYVMDRIAEFFAGV